MKRFKKAIVFLAVMAILCVSVFAYSTVYKGVTINYSQGYGAGSIIATTSTSATCNQWTTLSATFRDINNDVSTYTSTSGFIYGGSSSTSVVRWDDSPVSGSSTHTVLVSSQDGVTMDINNSY